MGAWSQLLGHERRPAWAQHPVILPWSKSTTQNPDRLRAAQAAYRPHATLYRPGINQLGVREREMYREGVMDKGLP